MYRDNDDSKLGCLFSIFITLILVTGILTIFLLIMSLISSDDKALVVGNVKVFVATVTPEYTPVPAATSIPESTPVPTATPIPECTSVPTATPIPECTPVPTATPIPEYTPVPTATPIPEYTPVPTATPIPECTSVPTATPIPEYTPVPTTTPIPECTPVPTIVPTPALTQSPIEIGKKEMKIFESEVKKIFIGEDILFDRNITKRYDLFELSVANVPAEELYRFLYNSFTENIARWIPMEYSYSDLNDVLRTSVCTCGRLKKPKYSEDGPLNMKNLLNSYSDINYVNNILVSYLAEFTAASPYNSNERYLLVCNE